ncbi:MAG: VWA domain-containing protein [Acidobacteriota bacterium]
MRWLAGVWALAALAQDQPRIAVDVQLVNLTAIVRDARGGLMPGLTKDDFEILEDGAAQTIRFFARQTDMPLSIGLLVDFSGSQQEFVKKHRRDIETFLKNVVGPKDRVFVVCFGNQLRLVADFTRDIDYVMDELKDFGKGNRRYTKLGGDQPRDGGTAFYDALYHATEKLRPEEGRRALVMFSDGGDNASAFHMLDAIESAQTADVLIYNVRYTTSEAENKPARSRDVYGQRVMERVSSDTGGMAFNASRDNPKAAFTTISEELHSLYEFGFHSTTPSQDGRFRRLEIHVKQSGLKARAKSGYYAR